MRQIVKLFILLIPVLTPFAEGAHTSALRYRTGSIGPGSEALFGGYVQCQREEAQLGCLPGFELEQGILKHLSLGFSTSFRSQGLFPSVSEGIPKFILGLSANYYKAGSFSGLWLQFNLRDKLYSSGGEAYTQVVALSPMVGYRWMGQDHPSNFALSVGFEKNISQLSNWLFLARAEIGLRFLWSEIFN